jgi:ketosteroid isomerase-like protein
MSEAEFELAQEMFAAAGRAHSGGPFDELYRLLDPEVEWIPFTAALEGAIYRGHEGVRHWIENMRRDWDVFEPRPEEFVDLGNERLLALGTWTARGRGSGVELDSQPAAWLIQFRNRRAVRMQTFTNRAEALEAAGLRE